MDWWIYVAIGGGAFLFLLIVVALLKKKAGKKAKKKQPPKPKEKPVKVQEPDNSGIIFDEKAEVDFSQINKVDDDKGEAYNPYADDDITGDFSDEDERRYQEFLAKHQAASKKAEFKNERKEDEFDKFRREHCYSKYFTDKALTKEILNMPDDARAVLFSEAFKKLNSDDFDIKI